ncbi:MAG: hypothetical protein IH944_09450 [Armatimonadetes bacterium]|nr:hypothetical protein [Armatimonadota bacterium]
MMHIRRFAYGLTAVAVLGADRLASGDCEVTELLPPSHLTGSVAIDGDVILTGAWTADGISNFTGAAFVFRYEGGTWEFEAKLQAPDGEFDDRFGWSVAISGDVAVVGSRDDEHEGFDVGSAYVYRFDGSGWIQEVKLIPPDGEFLDRFGVSSAIRGDVLVVGAYLDDDGGDRSGSAYVYRYNGSDWKLETKLVASDGAEGDEFGHSLAIEDNVIVVGARHFFNGGAGAAYIFRFNGQEWSEEAKLESSDGQDLDFFGDDVGISGNNVIVGAHGNDEAANHAGAAYIFSFDGKVWGDEQKVFALAPAHNDRFGESVAINGDLAIGGSVGDDPTGSITVFRLVNGNWIWTDRIEASDGSVGDQFSRAGIVLQNDVAVVSATHHHHGDSIGTAYVFAGLKLIDCDGNGVANSCQIADGSSQDCNSNFVPDACDIADGTSKDANDNGIPDECESPECPWDVNGDGIVDHHDLVEVVHNMGMCDDPDDCPWDVNGDGIVNGRDVAAVAMHFGPCP